jgi:hypothetical protein
MMRTIEVPERIGWLIAGLITVVAVTLHFGVYSSSPDVALHHAVVARLMNNWGLGPQDGVFLDVMVFYPPLAHWLAALGGHLLGSSTVSLAGLAIAAVFGGYAVIAAFLGALGSRRGLLAGLLMVGLVAVGRYGRAILGFEVVGNFFYPQVVATTLALAGYWIAYRLRDGAYPGLVRDSALFVWVCIIAWVHLLPALQLAASYGLIVLLEAIRDWRHARERTAVLRPILFASLTMAFMFVHPSVKVMRNVSAWNGGLEFAFRSSRVTLGVVALVAFAISALLLVSGVRARGLEEERSERVKIFIGASGIGAVLLLAAQGLALILGHGSPYAVKKHVFAVATATLVGCAIFLAEALARHRRGWAWLEGYPKSLGVIATSLFAWVCLALIVPARPDVKLNDLDHFRAFAIHASSYHLPPEAAGRIIAVDSTMPAAFNYLVTMGDLRYPWGPNSIDLLTGKWPLSNPKQVAAAIVDRGNPELDAKECEVSGLESEEYVVVRYDCALASKDKPVGPGVLSFRGPPTPGPGRRYLRDGWSGQEPGGIWSTGSASTLALRVDSGLQSGPLAIEFHLTPFLAPGHSAVTVRLSANGRPVEAKEFSGTSPESRVWSVVLPKGTVSDNQGLELTFKVQSPASPASLGLSGDLRPLGVMLHELRLSPVAGS